MLRRRRGRDEPRTGAEWLQRGYDLFAVDLVAAERAYRRAAELDPGLRGAWFDLGLIHKWRREWAESLECNRRAIAAGSQVPEGSHGDPAYWNAGIAATALHDWEAARWAWRGYGAPVSDGTGPIEDDHGPGVVRLPIGETVWGTRICPTRMRLESIPLPDSGFRCGDVVLHDGEPRGSRVAAGREYPVFEVILRWSTSPTPTTEVVVRCSSEEADELVDSLARTGIPAEDWTSSVAIHCAACSEGRVDYDDPSHDHAPPPSGDSHRVGCSAALADAEPIVRAWSAACGATVEALIEV